MKNIIKILLASSCFLVSVTHASPFGISCSAPVLTHVVADNTPNTFSLTCTNGTPATFNTVTFTPHQLSGNKGTVTIAPISHMTAGQSVTVQGALTLTAPDNYVFDFDLSYGGATHAGVLCKNDASSANCMRFTASAPDSFVGLTDIHYGKGDTDSTLWASVQTKLQQLIATQQPKFILLLGDLPAHHDTALTADIKTVLTDLSSTITTTPIYYVPGNNDSIGGDYHSFTDTSSPTPTPLSLDAEKNWPALNVSQSCSDESTTPSVAPCTIDTTSGAQFGYYSVHPVAGERLIVLNSVIFTARYVADDGVSQQDATDQELNWFDKQLSNAAAKNESVIIAMHVPFGMDAYSGSAMWASPTTQSRFINILTNPDYEPHIRGIFTGHTHMDELRRLYDKNHNLAALNISTPGITPSHSNNPAMKVFSYNPYNLNLTDVITHYTTATQSSDWNSYSFRQDYACGTKNIVTCASGFSINDKKFTDMYDYDYSVRNPAFPDQPFGWQGIWNVIDVVAQ